MHMLYRNVNAILYNVLEYLYVDTETNTAET